MRARRSSAVREVRGLDQVARGHAELSHEVAGLPTELDPENEEAKRFDLLALRLHLTLFCHEPGFEGLRDRVREIAALLAEKDAHAMRRMGWPCSCAHWWGWIVEPRRTPWPASQRARRIRRISWS